jgi:hypothetical protein
MRKRRSSILLSVMALVAVPSISAATAWDGACELMSSAAVDAQTEADFWLQQNGQKEPEPVPSLTPDEDYKGYRPDMGAGVIAPIGVENLSLRDCWMG